MTMKDKEIYLFELISTIARKKRHPPNNCSRVCLLRMREHPWREHFFLYSLSEFYDFLWSAKVKHVVCWYPYLSRPVGNLDTKFTLA